ncbi:hypothetical protein BH23PSE1_BH23PSE1_02500 [soil metagenome]
MELLFYRTETGNFGDDLNQWFWDEVLPGWRGWAPDTLLVGIGTILKQGFLPEGGHKLVIGSGVGYGRMPDIRADPASWDIRCVRGPRSAQALGLPPSLAAIDPAALLPEFGDFAGLERGDERLFVPHYGVAEKYDWERICAGTGITPLSPAGDPRSIICRIATARSVIAESMHAAIIADAFRTPWQCVAVSASFNAFKWTDWAQSVGVDDLEITRFFAPLRNIQQIAGRLRGAGAAPGDAARPAPARNAPPSGPEKSAGLLAPILAPMARKTIKTVAARPYRLSDAAVLRARKLHLLNILNDVARDYGQADSSFVRGALGAARQAAG